MFGSVTIALILASAGLIAGQRIDGDSMDDGVLIEVNVLFEYGMIFFDCQDHNCRAVRLSGITSDMDVRGEQCEKLTSNASLDCGAEIGPTDATFPLGSRLTFSTTKYQIPCEEGQDDYDDCTFFGVAPLGSNYKNNHGQLDMNVPNARKPQRLWLTSDLGPTVYLPSARRTGDPLLSGQTARVHYSTRMTASLGGDYSSRLRIAICVPQGRCHVVQLLGSTQDGAFVRQAYSADSITSTDWVTLRPRETSEWEFSSGSNFTFTIERRSNQSLVVWPLNAAADEYEIPLDEELTELWAYSYSAITYLPTDEPSTLPPSSGTSPDEPSTLPPPTGTPADDPSTLPPPTGTPADDPSTLPPPSGTPADEPSTLPPPTGTPADDPSTLPPPSGTPAGEPSTLPPPSGTPAEGSTVPPPTPTPSWPPLPIPTKCLISYEFLLIPVKGRCGHYIVCNWGRSQVMPCARGTLFHYELQTCDWPHNVHCT